MYFFAPENRRIFYETTGMKLPENSQLSYYRLINLNNRNRMFNLYSNHNTLNADNLTLPEYRKHLEKHKLDTKIKDLYLKHNNHLKNPDSLTLGDENGIIESDIYIHKSLGAKVHRDDVLLPNGRRGKLKENSKITKVVTFAGKGTKKSVKISGWLSEKYKEYKVHPTEWKKTRGDGYVVCDDGTTRRAELHWFESDKSGRVEMKVKRYFDYES